MANRQNLIYVRQASLARFSPQHLVVMEFQTAEDYVIAERVYEKWPFVGDELTYTWNPSFAQEFHMANDSRLFNQTGEGFPLYEGKMIHQFDSLFAQPRYWIPEKTGLNKLQNLKTVDWYKGYRFAFREVAGATNERTCIAAVLPPNAFVGHTLWVGVTPELSATLYFVTLINSFVVDWLARFKVNFHVTLAIMKELPIPRVEAGNRFFDAIVPRAARLTCTTPAFADLWQAVMGTPWQPDQAAHDPLTRQHLRDELDALVAHLYGLTREEYVHILNTFPSSFPLPRKGGHGWRPMTTPYPVHDA